MALALNLKECFSHGQVYTAMSRVPNIDGIRVLCASRGDEHKIINVVYHELLDNPPPRKSRRQPPLIDTADLPGFVGSKEMDQLDLDDGAEDFQPC